MVTKTSAKKPATKTPAKKAPADNKTKTAKPVSTSQKALHERISGALASVGKIRGGGGGKYSFFKLEEGQNIFRIVTPKNGPFCIPLMHHRGTRNGKFGTALNLGWLFNPMNIEFLEGMQERGKIASDDYKLFKKYGEPYDLLFKTLKAAGNEKLFTKKQIGQKRVMFLVWKDQAFHIMELSPTAAENINSLYEDNPDMFDWEKGQDIKTKGTGKKLKRKYTAPMLTGKPTPIEVDEEVNPCPNLLDVIAGRCLDYEAKVKFVMDSHGALVKTAGLSWEDFGVEEPEEDEEEETEEEVEDEEDEEDEE